MAFHIFRPIFPISAQKSCIAEAMQLHFHESVSF